MKILLVAATWLEIKIIADEFHQKDEKSDNLKIYEFNRNEIHILISGIGLTFTTFHLTQLLLSEKYDFVINAGIAGSFSEELKPGDLVEVISEEFADLGIEKSNEFLTLFEAGFMNKDEFPFIGGTLKSTGSLFPNLKKVKGLTVNKSHGRLSVISEIKDKFHGQVETMEGASVFYVCNWLGIPCCQVRAISNYVEPRETAKWNIPLALENLKTTILKGLSEI